MKRLILAPMVLLGAALLCGCGGGGSHVAPADPGGTTGRGGSATFTIRWPERPQGRLIPAECNSIETRIDGRGTVLASQTVGRPEGGAPAVVAFANLPAGNLMATATAYPNSDATGTPLATGSTAITIRDGENTEFTLTMAGITFMAGPLSGSTTWAGAVVLTGDVTVGSGANLTIQPGTVVKSRPNTDDQVGGNHTSRIELIVDEGTLKAEGTVDNPILFTSDNPTPQPGDWYGVRLATNNAAMRHCTVEYGIEGLRIASGTPTVAFCRLQDNTGWGLRLDVAGAVSDLTSQRNGGGILGTTSLTVARATVVDNVNTEGDDSNEGIRLYDGTLTVRDSTISGNKGGRAGVSGWNTTVVLENCTITQNEYYGVYGKDITAKDCTISDNQRVGGFRGHGIAVVAQGAGSGAVVTDTTIEGNDGDGIGSYYYTSEVVTVTASSLTGNGGYGIGDGVVAAVTQSTLLSNGAGGIALAQSVDRCTIAGNGGAGLTVGDLGASNLSGNLIWGNQTGVEVKSSSATVALSGGNDIFGNVAHELKNGGTAAVTANGNYWGDPTTSELSSGMANLTKVWDSRDDATVGQVVISQWAASRLTSHATPGSG